MQWADILSFAELARAGNWIVNVALPRKAAQCKAQAAEFENAPGGERADDIAAATDADDQCVG